MAGKRANVDIAKMTFEQALDELEDIVRGLETGEIDLEEAIKAYERGATLKQRCDEKLLQAQEKVSKILLTTDGSITIDSDPTTNTKDEPPF